MTHTIMAKATSAKEYAMFTRIVTRVRCRGPTISIAETLIEEYGVVLLEST